MMLTSGSGVNRSTRSTLQFLQQTGEMGKNPAKPALCTIPNTQRTEIREWAAAGSMSPATKRPLIQI